LWKRSCNFFACLNDVKDWERDVRALKMIQEVAVNYSKFGSSWRSSWTGDQRPSNYTKSDKCSSGCVSGDSLSVTSWKIWERRISAWSFFHAASQITIKEHSVTTWEVFIEACQISRHLLNCIFSGGEFWTFQ
jgi:hypothetical protein